jgi:predicted DNA-binding protein with PD1-like motif
LFYRGFLVLAKYINRNKAPEVPRTYEEKRAEAYKGSGLVDRTVSKPEPEVVKESGGSIGLSEPAVKLEQGQTLVTKEQLIFQGKRTVQNIKPQQTYIYENKPFPKGHIGEVEIEKAMSVPIESLVNTKLQKKMAVKKMAWIILVFVFLFSEVACLSGLNGGVKAYAFRLTPEMELKQALLDFTLRNGIEAAYVASCVGSVKNAHVRMASYTRDNVNETNQIRQLHNNNEILSLVGTLGPDGAHLHIALSDPDGAVVGGHLISAKIFTTAEVILHEITRIRFSRKFDQSTGFNELDVIRIGPLWGNRNFLSMLLMRALRLLRWKL